MTVSRSHRALENIIEANILLSGLGFESGGLAGAHAIHDGLTILEGTHKYFHGEKVAFGTIVQLMLENAPEGEMNEVLDFCVKVGLPVCLEDIGVDSITREELIAGGRESLYSGGICLFNAVPCHIRVGGSRNCYC